MVTKQETYLSSYVFCVGVSVFIKHFYYYLFCSRWKFMSKIAIGQL